MEELLHRCSVLYKKRSFELLLTADRMVLHPSEGATAESEILQMTSIKSFVPTKPRPDLPHQKVLVKLGFESGAELVLDFNGIAEHQRKVEKILREHAGDRARERLAKAAEEEKEIARRRAKFLHDRPALRIVYEALVEKEKALTPDDFWKKYDPDTFEGASDVTATTTQVPKPMNVNGTLTITAERKREIFAQFPEAEKLYKSAVPDLVSESDFWRRFVSCQFFWKTQGRERETAKDMLFDGLLQTVDTGPSKSERPAFVGISPTVDLTADYLGDERRKDRASELGERVNPEAFATLVSRFNKVAEKRFSTQVTAESVEQAAELRLRALEEELDPGTAEVQTTSQHLLPNDLAKLLATYVDVKHPDGAVWRQAVDHAHLPTLEREGAANEVTMTLSQNLKNLDYGFIAEENLDKAGKTLMASEFNKEFDLFAEQVNELLRHFWTSSDKVKRVRIIAALMRKRSEIENSLGKAPTIWAHSLKALLNAIDCADKISRK